MPNSRKKQLTISLAALITVGLLIFFNTAVAADGSGTNTVSPTSAIASSVGNTLTFTFTAAEKMDSGEIAVTVPGGWSAPQGTSGVAGYTTVSSAAGTVARVEDTKKEVVVKKNRL